MPAQEKELVYGRRTAPRESMPRAPGPRTETPVRATRAPLRRRLIPAGLILAAVGAVAIIATLPKQAPAPAPTEVLPVNVGVLRIRPVPELADTLTLVATVEPECIVRVSAEVPGRIERLGQRLRDVQWRGRTFPAGSTVAEGEPVSAGDPIVHLNAELLQARYDRALAQFEYEQREYRRLLDLFERGATSKTELDDAATRRDVSRATLEEIARELARTTIVAPTDGILNRLPMEIGEYAGTGDVVAEIVKVDRVKVVVDVPERDVSCFQVGAEATVLAPGAEIPGQITYISELADAGTRTSRLEITVDNRDQLLRSGQILRARLTRRVLRDAIMIPLSAVIPLEEGRLVYVVEDGVARPRQVELGLIQGRNVCILSGLRADDLLIVDGHRYVGPGQPVRIVQEQ
jgi:membrane fusion protein (multidrug efflux system)